MFKIAPVIRQVSDGPFAMRVGPEECFFFVVSDGKIQLEKKEYVHRDHYNRKKIIYKKIKIY